MTASPICIKCRHKCGVLHNNLGCEIMGRKPSVTIKVRNGDLIGEVKPFAKSGGYIPMSQEYVGKKVKVTIIEGKRDGPR